MGEQTRREIIEEEKQADATDQYQIDLDNLETDQQAKMIKQ